MPASKQHIVYRVTHRVNSWWIFSSKRGQFNQQTMSLQTTSLLWSLTNLASFRTGNRLFPALICTSEAINTHKHILPSVTLLKGCCGPQVEQEDEVHPACGGSYFLKPEGGCTPPVPCMVRIGQRNFLNCPSMCLQPPPLILGQFTRGNKSEWAKPRVDCGRSLRRGKPVFLNHDWSIRACRREKASDRMSWLVGYFCRRKWVLKYPNLKAWGWQSLAASKNINSSLT